MNLHKGDRFTMPGSGARYRVLYANESRARVAPLAPQRVTVGDRTFKAQGRAVDIAPDALVEDLTPASRARSLR